jgi:hypothetical protein
MKLAILVVVLAGSAAHAQPVSIGAYGGVNRSTADGAPAASAPVVGVRVELGLGSSFALGGALEYSGGAIHLASTPGGMTSPVDYRVGYLAAPIGMRLQLGRGRFPFHVSAGTTVGALLFASETMDGNERDARQELGPFEVTADLGAGVSIRLTPRISLDLEGRWSVALIDGAKRDAATDLDAWQTQNVQILAGLTFTLNPRPAMPMMPGWN